MYALQRRTGASRPCVHLDKHVQKQNMGRADGNRTGKAKD